MAAYGRREDFSDRALIEEQRGDGLKSSRTSSKAIQVFAESQEKVGCKSKVQQRDAKRTLS